MTIGKTIALTTWTFVGKVTSLLFNNLRPVKAIKSGTAVLLAVYDGKTRLIDNRVID